MSGISSYILSIAGVVLISIIVDFAMPDGSMNKYIKSIMGFFIIAVIISPLPSLLKTNDFSSFFDTAGYELQEDYLYKLNESKVDVLTNEIKTMLNGEGYQNVELEIKQNNKISAELDLKFVIVDLSHIVILDKAEHKNISDIKSRIDELLIEKKKKKKEQIIYET